MEDERKPGIKDIILKQYELTDTYHDHKTHSAWIASTVYFAFSIGFFSYAPELLENPSTTIKIIETIICSAIFTGAMSFISLQFKSRWDSVIRTSMYNWLFDYKWDEIKTPENYRELKDRFDNIEKRRQKAGLTQKRKIGSILWMTPILPLLLIANFLYMTFAKKDPKDIKVDEFDNEPSSSEPPKSRNQKRQYRKKRRLTAGLLDTKYRTEIPAYTISFYFYIAQIIFIWCKSIL